MLPARRLNKPVVAGMATLGLPTCGSLIKFQSYVRLPVISNMYNGVRTFLSFVRSSPASMTPTDMVGISERRLATTSPAVPPPAMRKSKLVEAKASGDSIRDIFDAKLLQTLRSKARAETRKGGN